MNRTQRRAARIKDPLGNALDVRLLLVQERDPITGRPTVCRVCYDDEILGAVLEGRSSTDKNEFLLVWMGADQQRKLD